MQINLYQRDGVGSLKHFMNLEINEIEKYKWIESEKVGYDLGVLAEIRWVELYAAIFRKEYIFKYGEINEEYDQS